MIICSSTSVAQNPVYCTPQSEFPFQDWIEDVTVGPLVNLESGKFLDYSTAGYSDYTDLVAPVIDRTQPVDFNLVAGFSGCESIQRSGTFYEGKINALDEI